MTTKNRGLTTKIKSLTTKNKSLQTELELPLLDEKKRSTERIIEIKDVNDVKDVKDVKDEKKSLEKLIEEKKLLVRGITILEPVINKRQRPLHIIRVLMLGTFTGVGLYLTYNYFEFNKFKESLDGSRDNRIFELEEIIHGLTNRSNIINTTIGNYSAQWDSTISELKDKFFAWKCYRELPRSEMCDSRLEYDTYRWVNCTPIDRHHEQCIGFCKVQKISHFCPFPAKFIDILEWSQDFCSESLMNLACKIWDNWQENEEIFQFLQRNVTQFREILNETMISPDYDAFYEPFNNALVYYFILSIFGLASPALVIGLTLLQSVITKCTDKNICSNNLSEEEEKEVVAITNSTSVIAHQSHVQTVSNLKTKLKTVDADIQHIKDCRLAFMLAKKETSDLKCPARLFFHNKLAAPKNLAPLIFELANS